jgi:hypothetical protein
LLPAKGVRSISFARSHLHWAILLELRRRSREWILEIEKRSKRVPDADRFSLPPDHQAADPLRPSIRQGINHRANIRVASGNLIETGNCTFACEFSERRTASLIQGRRAARISLAMEVSISHVAIHINPRSASQTGSRKQNQ